MTDGKIRIEVDASDVGKAKKELDSLSSSVENLEDTSKSTTRTFVETQRELAALGTASRETSKAVDEVRASLSNSAKQLRSINNSWKETADAQNKAMYSYNKVALAEEAAREKAVKTRAENEKKRAGLEKLLGAIDKTEKALNILDKQELELTKHFKAGRIEVDAYNGALAKIQAKRNALTTIKNEAKSTTQEVGKLSKAIKLLSGLAVTGFAGYGAISFGKSVIETSIQMDKAKTIMENATGSASKAGEELDFVRGISKKLNIELISAANGYAKLVAAAQGTPELTNKVQGMFEGVSEAASVLKLAPHEVNSILVNFEQMISKGKVDLTDLKQIANLIPGTFEKAAQGLGTNTKTMAEWISKGLVPASEFLPRFSEELHKAFGGSAQRASQGLQGQLNALTNAWTELKEEAGNAGFVDTFTDAVKELTNVLKDPAMKEGLNTLISGLAQLSKWSAQGLSNAAGNIKKFSEDAAAKKYGINADDGGRFLEAEQNAKAKLNEKQANLAKAISKGNQPDDWIRLLKAYVVEAEKEYSKAAKDLEEFQKRYYQNWKRDNDKIGAEAAKEDPIVKQYKETKTKLAEAQKQLDEQMKADNGNIDVNLADQKDIYQKNLDELQAEIQSKYDGLLKEQDSQSSQLKGLQDQYAEYSANLTKQQKEAVLGQIAQIKTYLAELDKTISQFKPYALVTNKPFVPTNNNKGRTGKSAAQRQAESNEKWVEGLEKQGNTMNLNKADTLAYEISQRKLTGALLERANAVKKVYEEEQKLANAKTNEDLRTQILYFETNDFEAQMREIDAAYREAVKQYTKDGNTEGIDLSKQLFDKKKIKLQLDAVQGQVDKFYNSMHVQEQSIQAQVQANLITQYEGQKRLTALHKQTADVIEKSIPELEKLAQQPGALGEQARQKLTEMRTQVLLLKQTANELENAFRNGLQDGIQSSIDGLVKGTMNLNEALNNLLQTIASSILNQAVQNVASQATDGLFAGLKSLGGLFGMGADDPAATDSSPQATAILSSSQHGALAMQTAIEQGGAMAAQSMASAISSVGGMGGVGQVGGEAGLFGDVTAHSQEAIAGIQGVQAAKTAADTTMAASSAAAAATTTASTTAAATAATTAWAPAAAASSVASFGSAAMIGLAALMMVLTAARAFESGGHVSGPGTGTSDSIPAWLSNNEFVTRSAIVKQPGMLPFLNDLNKRGWGAVNDITAVRHATGGLAGVPATNITPSTLPIPKNGLPENNSSTTLKNSQMFVLSDNPDRIINSAYGERGLQVLQVEISKNPQKWKSLLEIG